MLNLKQKLISQLHKECRSLELSSERHLLYNILPFGKAWLGYFIIPNSVNIPLRISTERSTCSFV